MAEKPDKPDPLLREIDEELRQERYAKLWKRYGNWAIGGALGVVIAVAGYQGWKTWELSRRTAASDRFAATIELAQSGKLDAAEKAFADLATQGPAGYALLARFQEAQAAQRQGDAKRAAATWRTIAADTGSEPVLRDLALLLAALADANTADPKALSTEIARLAQDDSPWRHSARELLAILAVRSGERDQARDRFQKLADDTAAPQGVRTRAREMAAALAQAS